MLVRLHVSDDSSYIGHTFIQESMIVGEFQKWVPNIMMEHFGTLSHLEPLTCFQWLMYREFSRFRWSLLKVSNRDVEDGVWSIWNQNGLVCGMVDEVPWFLLGSYVPNMIPKRSQRDSLLCSQYDPKTHISWCTIALVWWSFSWSSPKLECEFWGHIPCSLYKICKDF